MFCFFFECCFRLQFQNKSRIKVNPNQCHHPRVYHLVSFIDQKYWQTSTFIIYHRQYSISSFIINKSNKLNIFNLSNQILLTPINDTKFAMSSQSINMFFMNKMRKLCFYCVSINLIGLLITSEEIINAESMKQKSIISSKQLMV